MNRCFFSSGTFICIIISVLLLTGCGGGGSGSGGGGYSGGDTGSGASQQSSSTVGWGNVPVPSGYTSIPVTLSSGTLAATLKSADNDAKAFQEAYLMLVYHSQNPSSNGNPVPVDLTLTKSTKDAERIDSILYEKLIPGVLPGPGSGAGEESSANSADNALILSKSAESKSADQEMEGRFDEYQNNHLERLQHNSEFLKKMIELGKAPRSLSNEELKAKGRLDLNGSLKADTAGTERNFWIYLYSTSTYQIASCTCRAVGQNCYVYTNNNDSSYYSNIDQYAGQIADYFDSTVYPTVHQNVGNEWNPGIDGDSRVYIILSVGISNSYINFADEYQQSQLPAGEKSNECEIIYMDPLIFTDTGEMAESQLSVMQAVTGHEFTHLVRFNMKYVAGNNDAPPAFTNMSGYTDSDNSLQEGCAIYTENVLLNRGITSNSNKIAQMRARGLERYLRQTSKSTLTSTAFNRQNNDGLGVYEMGFFIVQYLYERLGASSIKVLNQTDGKVGLASLSAAAGQNSFSDIFDMQALTILLSGKVSDPVYTLRGADLSGSTGYGAYTLHDAWSAATNVYDFGNGIDVSQIDTKTYSFTLYEWSPLYIRLYNTDGKDLSIQVNGFSAGGGAGSVNAYTFYR
ncbi:MAG: hypothetical protein AB2L14_15450 [Candidatus Xenobiia bacterium LiM19]